MHYLYFCTITVPLLSTPLIRYSILPCVVYLRPILHISSSVALAACKGTELTSRSLLAPHRWIRSCPLASCCFSLKSKVKGSVVFATIFRASLWTIYFDSDNLVASPRNILPLYPTIAGFLLARTLNTILPKLPESNCFTTAVELPSVSKSALAAKKSILFTSSR